MVGGDLPFYVIFWAKLTISPLQKMDISNRYSLVATQPLHLAKKSSIIANRQSTMGFPMSLGWTAYVAHKPPKVRFKNQSVRLPYKSGLLSKKVCYKVSLCENFQRQSCKAFTGLSICVQMVGGGCRFLPGILGQIDQPPCKTPTSNQYLFVAHQPLHWAKKSSYEDHYGLSNEPKMNSIRCVSAPTLQRGLSAIDEFLVSRLVIRQFRPFPLIVLSLMLISNCTILLYDVLCNRIQYGCVARVLICLKCREENRPLFGQQHQAQFGINPALQSCLRS